MQRGLSLVEAAVAMAIMGVSATMLWQTVSGSKMTESQNRARADLQRADAAVRAFVAVHHRFPCPAIQADGLESCAGSSTSGFLPYLTLGMPQARGMRIRYEVHAVLAASEGRFMALVNDRPIGPDSDPRAVPVALRNLLGVNYDGMLDVCESLSRMAEAGAVAYDLEATAPLHSAPAWGQRHPRRMVAATQVASHLGCGPMVAVAGRGQYNAHLASAIMVKAIQDHRRQSEVAYSLKYWNLSEGIWSFSNGMYSAMKNWAKLLQTGSALDANIWSNPGPFVVLHAKAAVDRAVEMVGVAARASNLARYITNLEDAQENLVAQNTLVRDTLSLYERTTRHAMLGSSSAWFLREQQQAPSLNEPSGLAGDYGPNASAQALTRLGQKGAEVLGHGDMLSPYTQIPEGTRGADDVQSSGQGASPP